MHLRLRYGHALISLQFGRYQDIRAEFSNDGVRGQWIKIREWSFRHCFNKSKYQVQEEDHAEVAKRHHAEVKVLESKSNRLMKLASTQESEDSEPAEDDAAIVPPTSAENNNPARP